MYSNNSSLCYILLLKFSALCFIISKIQILLVVLFYYLFLIFRGTHEDSQSHAYPIVVQHDVQNEQHGRARVHCVGGHAGSQRLHHATQTPAQAHAHQAHGKVPQTCGTSRIGIVIGYSLKLKKSRTKNNNMTRYFAFIEELLQST